MEINELVRLLWRLEVGDAIFLESKLHRYYFAASSQETDRKLYEVISHAKIVIQYLDGNGLVKFQREGSVENEPI